jgi:hypothetical protein
MIRPFGTQQVEIVVPEVEGVAIAEMKRNIATAGELRFRIVANSKDHGRKSVRRSSGPTPPRAPCETSAIPRENTSLAGSASAETRAGWSRDH